MSIKLSAEFVRDYEALEAVVGCGILGLLWSSEFVRKSEAIEAEAARLRDLARSLEAELSGLRDVSKSGAAAKIEAVRAKLQGQLDKARSEIDALRTERDEASKGWKAERARAADLEAKLAEAPRVEPRPPTSTDAQLAVAHYELEIARENVRRLEEENDSLREELHWHESSGTVGQR